jgi:hypothetical protein
MTIKHLALSRNDLITIEIALSDRRRLAARNSKDPFDAYEWTKEVPELDSLLARVREAKGVDEWPEAASEEPRGAHLGAAEREALASMVGPSLESLGEVLLVLAQLAQHRTQDYTRALELGTAIKRAAITVRGS